MSPSPAFDKGMICDECGAVVYQEHLDRGLAVRRDEKLLCPHCLAEQKQAEAKAYVPEAEPLSLVAEPQTSDRTGPGSPMGSAVGPTVEPPEKESTRYKRQLVKTGQGASRMRAFHTKMSEAGLRNLEIQVNEWLDANPEVEIKFASTTVGAWEGRHTETHLIVTVYY